MAAMRFTDQDIDRFNDKISNVLQNTRCKQIYNNYLKKYSPPNCNAFKLWEQAHSTKEYNEDLLLDMIEDVDGFNDNPLLTLAEPEHKLIYIKQECCRILEKSRSNFIQFLRTHHM
ncbi:unnamed protein product [Psylliodes chrysocephalus]|uniref:Uncharacterized protein n=1 Tax=Psylliodes chrysocephalus TaxID=3402493 RepID=A0A9P0G7M9_9CUCU|nr:unnamed protein product [Psylliodes chrysocephala]